jgi:hypothetical protein
MGYVELDGMGSGSSQDGNNIKQGQIHRNTLNNLRIELNLAMWKVGRVHY